MSGRSKTKNIKSSRRKNEGNKFDKPESLTLQDVQCTVCMGIFVEPVTLPCNHTTCKICFEKTIDNNSLACPLCRKYVGGWIRQRQKNGLLVNQALWAHIREHFEPHVKKKIKGEDDEVIDGLHEQNIPAPKICEPGLIRKEYEAERKRIEEEAQKRQELEAQASAKLIKELQEHEEEERRHLEELRKKAEEEDALIAQRIAAELREEETRKEAEEEETLRRMLEEEQANSAFVRLPSHATLIPSSETPNKKGPMDAFLNNLGKPTRTASSSSTDSLNSELHHFKPVHKVPTTPPKSSPGEDDCDSSQVCKPMARMFTFNSMASSSVTGPSSCSLRPWLQKGMSNLSSTTNPEQSTPVAHPKGKRRQKSPFGVVAKPPKRAKIETSRKVSIFEPIRSKILTMVGKQKNDSRKTMTKDSDSGRETDCEDELENFDRPESLSLNESSSSESTRNPFKPKSHYGMIQLELPLSLEDMSESAEVEKRYRQEQEDHEFALKLQEELNAVVNQSRTYDLRSVVAITPKKSQTNVVTPTRKLRPKPAARSGNREKRRQCTLEESMSFSVKMGL